MRLAFRITRPRTIGVRAVVLDHMDRIALVRHTYIDQWYLPGGGVNRGESISAALTRELSEELALRDPHIERVLGAYHSRNEAKDDHIIIFVVRVLSNGDELIPNVDVNEIEEARWFALDQVPSSLSPATARRIAEYRAGLTGAGQW
ncbi:ADP-ribose pyrophosphatase YjhB (NUDIX family) [Sphingobium subterraneum]|uniref:ADP-ribose pyrophosphatase YjhB (NUDIX family) n=2 Tax=Sphingobium subterraneum TaxID=627688 RepID=A0A841J5E5_9SPHN|nr:ADP-ribose pyrophosphatase YjhB (NUDIX family) [Sphingobium subterraneum]